MALGGWLTVTGRGWPLSVQGINERHGRENSEKATFVFPLSPRHSGSRPLASLGVNSRNISLPAVASLVREKTYEMDAYIGPIFRVDQVLHQRNAKQVPVLPAKWDPLVYRWSSNRQLALYSVTGQSAT
ncbi:hypothetical protein BaRGS_00010471, partial [Batillaria attramentaria]